jgi:hypothetical protein
VLEHSLQNCGKLRYSLYEVQYGRLIIWDKTDGKKVKVLLFINKLVNRYFQTEVIELSFTLDERKTNLMQLLYIFIVAVGDAVHVSGVFAHRQER